MSEDANRDELTETVATACRVLGSLEVTHGALGHVSCRLGDGESMLIKAKGPSETGLRYTTTDDIIEVGFDATKRSGPDGLWPPSESYIHLWLYKKRPDVRAVVHVHPEHAVLLTICDKEIVPIYGAYWPLAAQLAIEGVSTYPFSLVVDDDRLGEEFADFVGDRSSALMRGHGATTVGSSIEEATLRAIALDQLTTMTYKAYVLGTLMRLPDAEIESLRRGRDRTAERRGSAGGPDGLRAVWRYYTTLAGE